MESKKINIDRGNELLQQEYGKGNPEYVTLLIMELITMDLLDES